MAVSPPTLLKRASDHLARGELGAARRLFEEMLTGSPLSSDARHGLGLVALRRGDVSEGVRWLTDALDQRPSVGGYCDLAHGLVRLGRFDEAAIKCRQALELDPSSADAYQILAAALEGLGDGQGVLAALASALQRAPERSALRLTLAAALGRAGRMEASLELLQTGLALDPRQAELHFHKGNALYQLERIEDAALAYQEALNLRSDHMDAAQNLGAAHRSLGRNNHAVAAYKMAADINPFRLEPLVMLSGILVEQRAFAEAVPICRRALGLERSNFAARLSLGIALANLGENPEAIKLLQAVRLQAPTLASPLPHLALAFRQSGRFQEAIAAYQKAIELGAPAGPTYANLGGTFKDAGQFEQAIAACQMAIWFDPGCSDAFTNMGAAQIELDRLEEGMRSLEQAIALNSQNPFAQFNLAVGFYRQGETDAAIKNFEAALSLAEVPFHRWGYGLALLRRGRFKEGWEAFEHRLAAEDHVQLLRPSTAPYWLGETGLEKTLLLEAEQGAGDTIQCLRFISLASARVGSIILRVAEPLASLCRTLPGVKQVIVNEPFENPDFRCSLFSLPGMLGADFELIPQPPYLFPDPALVQAWSERLSSAAFKVGIVWQGNPTAAVERGRSIPLSAFSPLLGLSGVEVFSLQKQHGLDQLASASARRLLTLGPSYDQGDYEDTAAVLMNLDLVVSCDTSVAHLAGALGRPVWLGLNAVGDWRWLEERSDTPWYPSMRLYRQQTQGNWRQVLTAMASDLAALVGDDAQGVTEGA